MINIPIEFEKRFSKKGEFQKKITILKELKKKYPQNETVEALRKIFRQKIYGIKGGNFIYEKIGDIFESQFPFQNGILEIEGVKFDFTSSSARVDFYSELADLLLSDDYFKKSENNQTFYKIIAECLIADGPYQHASAFLKHRDVVVDIGANIGMFSLFANKFFDCKCYAFEPVKETVNFLKKNIKLNHAEQKIDVVPYALSDRECDVDIQIGKNTAGSSFVQKIDCIGTEKIHCITLDQWAKENHISQIDFIKADIEGAERYMLAGATKVLQKIAPKLSICTYHLPDDPQVLEEIILNANPKYKVEHANNFKKLYAYVPE